MKRRAVSISRRRFLGTSGAAAALFHVVPSRVLAAKTRNKGGKQSEDAPSDKLNIAFVGAGGRANGNIGGCSSQNVYILCDVDKNRCGGSVKKYPAAKFYTDWRAMLDKEADTIDAVVVSTPDHCHAIVSMAAMQLGKHVYVEKPMTRTVSEARALREAARKYKVCTQMGNQGHASEGARLTNEWIRSGAIGEVREVHTASNRPIWPQDIVRPPAEPVPAHLDWDVWLGPAPDKPYSGQIVPFKWRGYWDYGAGALGDMGAHIIDHPVWALELGPPLSVVAEYKRNTPGSEKDTFPQSSIVTYEFAARGDAPPVTMKWFDGKNRIPHPEMLEDNRKAPGNGCVYFGSKYAIMHNSHGGAPRVIPEEKMKVFERPPKTMERSPGHHREWIQAIKANDPSMAKSNFDYAGPLTETMLLGCVAVRLPSGTKLTWDSENMRTNNDVANRYLQHEYRKGWML
jgi:predicted dehydrogenase